MAPSCHWRTGTRCWSKALRLHWPLVTLFQAVRQLLLVALLVGSSIVSHHQRNRPPPSSSSSGYALTMIGLLLHYWQSKISFVHFVRRMPNFGIAMSTTAHKFMSVIVLV